MPYKTKVDQRTIKALERQGYRRQQIGDMTIRHNADLRHWYVTWGEKVERGEKVDIRDEVEALLTRLFLPKYEDVLSGWFLSIIAKGMAQNLGAIESELKQEVARRQTADFKLRLLTGIPIDVLREMALTFGVASEKKLDKMRLNLNLRQLKIAIADLFHEVPLDDIRGRLLLDYDNEKLEFLKGLPIGLLRDWASRFNLASEKKLNKMRSKIAIAMLFDDTPLNDILYPEWLLQYGY